jgi:hypothetical protein
VAASGAGASHTTVPSPPRLRLPIQVNVNTASVPASNDRSSWPWLAPQSSEDQIVGGGVVEAKLLHLGADVAAAGPGRDVLDLIVTASGCPRAPRARRRSP